MGEIATVIRVPPSDFRRTLGQALLRIIGCAAAGKRHPRPMHIFKVVRYCVVHVYRGLSGADGIGGHDPEMIRRVRTQSRDVRSDILVIIASLGLVGRSGSVVDGSSILKVSGGAELVGIYCPVKRG